MIKLQLFEIVEMDSEKDSLKSPIIEAWNILRVIDFQSRFFEVHVAIYEWVLFKEKLS